MGKNEFAAVGRIVQTGHQTAVGTAAHRLHSGSVQALLLQTGDFVGNHILHPLGVGAFAAEQPDAVVGTAEILHFKLVVDQTLLQQTGIEGRGLTANEVDEHAGPGQRLGGVADHRLLKADVEQRRSHRHCVLHVLLCHGGTT